MPVRQLSDGNPDGAVLGQSASDLISFYNASPVAQRSGGGPSRRPNDCADELKPLRLQPGPGDSHPHASE
jgi:hypothetical protein